MGLHGSAMGHIHVVLWRLPWRVCHGTCRSIASQCQIACVVGIYAIFIEGILMSTRLTGMPWRISWRVPWAIMVLRWAFMAILRQWHGAFMTLPLVSMPSLTSIPCHENVHRSGVKMSHGTAMELPSLGHRTPSPKPNPNVNHTQP